jgi:hypothetical protein
LLPFPLERPMLLADASPVDSAAVIHETTNHRTITITTNRPPEVAVNPSVTGAILASVA